MTRSLPAVVSIIAVWTSAQALAADTLKSPIDSEASRAAYGASDQVPARFQCQPFVPPMVDMSNLFSFYVPSDRTQSQVDPERMNAYFNRLDDNKRFKNIVNDGSDLYVLSSPARSDVRNCVLAHLAHWGRAGAFLGNTTAQKDDVGRRQAILIQAWWLTAYAIDFLKVDGPRTPNAEQLSDIRDWFSRLSASITEEFTPNERRAAWLNRTTNHSHWGALAVGLAGVALGDDSKLQFSVAELRRALDQVDDNGALPIEMKRGKKALHYQSFALLPLAGLLAVADANGINLDPRREEALRRLVTFTLNETRQPNVVVKLSGQQQEPIYNAPHLAWVDIVLPHFAKRNPALAEDLDQTVARFRPLKYEFLGGEVSRIFNLNITGLPRGPHH